MVVCICWAGSAGEGAPPGECSQAQEEKEKETEKAGDRLVGSQAAAAAQQIGDLEVQVQVGFELYWRARAHTHTHTHTCLRTHDLCTVVVRE